MQRYQKKCQLSVAVCEKKVCLIFALFVKLVWNGFTRKLFTILTMSDNIFDPSRYTINSKVTSVRCFGILRSYFCREITHSPTFLELFWIFIQRKKKLFKKVEKKTSPQSSFVQTNKTGFERFGLKKKNCSAVHISVFYLAEFDCYKINIKTRL